MLFFQKVFKKGSYYFSRSYFSVEEKTQITEKIQEARLFPLFSVASAEQDFAFPPHFITKLESCIIHSAFYYPNRYLKFPKFPAVSCSRQKFSETNIFIEGKSCGRPVEESPDKNIKLS